MDNQHPFALYNPALLPPDTLLAEFTARRPLLDTLLQIVGGNEPGQPPQHVLLIGARGMGKTTTLWAVAHRIARDAELSKAWHPVVFDEESRRVGDLADFWLECIRQWEHATNDPGDRAGDLLRTAAADIEERAQETFLLLVSGSGRRALLLIDNFNDLLGSIHDPAPLHRLRALLMKDARIMIVGSATRYFEEVTSVDQPFYDFFRCFDLHPLSLDEMRGSLLALAKTRGDEAVKSTIEKRGGTVQALHILTGGNPRLIKTFYRLLRDGLRADIRTELERLLDEFTPYFKSIVDALPVQQQRIFDAVALAWDPVEVAAVSVATRLPSNQVSAQLRSLVRSGMLCDAGGRPKRKTYLLADRFSNIHYLMRHGRAARNRLDWFVALVRLVFPDQEGLDVLARVARDAAVTGAEGLCDARDVLRSAFNRAGSVQARKNLAHATLRETWNHEALARLHEWFDTQIVAGEMPEIAIIDFCRQMPVELRRALGYQPEKAEWWLQLIDFLETRGAWGLVEAAFSQSISVDPQNASAWRGLGNVRWLDLERPESAEAAFLKAIDLRPADAWAWLGLGSVRFEMNRLDDAEAACRRSMDLDGANPVAWLSLAGLLMLKGETVGAEVAFRRSLELDNSLGSSWCLLGLMLSKQADRMDEARHCCRNAISLSLDETVRNIFREVCSAHAEDWRDILPTVTTRAMSHPESKEVFDFAVEGFVQLARLAKPADALAVLNSLPDASPFETLRDAFIAHSDREHLHRLAPERRAVVLELLRRISERTVQTK